MAHVIMRRSNTVKSRLASGGNGAEWAQRLGDSVSHGMLVVDGARVIRAVNRRMLELLGRRASSVVGKRLDEIMFVRDPVTGEPRDIEACVARASSAGKEFEVEQCVLDGRTRSHNVSFTVVPGAAGQLGDAGFSVHGRETTLETESVQLRDAILSMVSHELRTPLLHIKGFVSSLLESDIQWDDETRLDFLHTIDREADRLTEMVGDRLQISRIRTGDLPLKIEPVDPYLLAHAGIDEASPFLRRHRVEVEVPEKMAKVPLDANRIIGVFVNLIENATKHSEAGSTITIRAVARETHVIFSVEDQGEGVPHEFQGEIFELFSRGPARKGAERPPGTGLGLAVCKTAVEAHGGRIWVESEPDHGSIFSFTVPTRPARQLPGKAGRSRARTARTSRQKGAVVSRQ